MTSPADPLPCGLASSLCTDQGGGLIACIDEYFGNDGACGTDCPHPTFPTFTALPQPNDYRADCFAEPDPCDIDLNGALRFTLDVNGNLFFPVSWQGVPVPGQIPIPRLLRTHTRSPVPFRVPDQVFVDSFTPEGGLLPPIFEPQIDDSIPDPNIVTLFGSTDAPYTILRFAQHHGTCVSNPTKRCANDLDCSGSSCATSCVGNPALQCTTDAECLGNGPCGKRFDFSSLAGAGPLVLPRTVGGICQETAAICSADCNTDGPCVSYAFEAQTPVFPSSLREATDEIRSFTPMQETTLEQRATGGAQGGLYTGNHSDISDDGQYLVFSSVSVLDTTLPAPGDNNGKLDIFLRDRISNVTTLISLDQNGNVGIGDSYDPVYSSYGILFTSESSLFLTDPGGIDVYWSFGSGSVSFPYIGGRSPAISSDGRQQVWHREPPDGDVQLVDWFQGTGTVTYERIDSASDGTGGTGGASSHATISRDGRFVAFSSTHSDLTPDDANGTVALFLSFQDRTL